jgi:hypothetical protein
VKPLLIGACALAMAGGVMVGRTWSSRQEQGRAERECSSTPAEASVLPEAPRSPIAKPSRAPQLPALPRTPGRALTPWETLVVDQPEATQLVQQAVQTLMSDMSWARALHDCTRQLTSTPSRVRFTATIRNDGGALTIVDWTSHLLDGPDVPAGTLGCIEHGLPTGPLDLAERWPGAAPSLEYDLEMSLER